MGENLSLAGETISVSSLISSVLTGFDSEYLPIICQINEQGNITWHELHATLIIFENTLHYMKSMQSSETLNPIANYAAKSVDFNKNQYQQQPNGQGRNQNFNQRGGRGKPRGQGGRYGNNSKPTCQVRGKYGHSAYVYYHRFDK